MAGRSEEFRWQQAESIRPYFPAEPQSTTPASLK
jgi:hypothetical protein